MKAIKSTRILGESGFIDGYVVIDGERIVQVSSQEPGSMELVDYGSLVVMPGILDPHVHINEPGRTEWEGFETATKAAAKGGITTIVDMPLNCLPVTTSEEAVQIKRKALEKSIWVDCGLWGGVTPDSITDLPGLLEAGVLGVKSFLIDSGIEEFPPMAADDLDQAMDIIAKVGVPYLIHAELESEVDGEITQDYDSFVRSRPDRWEIDAINLMIEKQNKNQCPVHIVHLAAAAAIPSIEKAKAAGNPLTVETCPHYLTISAENIPRGKTIYKCCPPIRGEDNRKALWQGSKDNVIDFIASDHSPCLPKLKEIETGNLEKAWGGISSLQFLLPLVWTEAKNNDIGLEQVSSLLSGRVAKFLGLDNFKGKLAPGYDADIIVWDPDEKFQITKEEIFHRHKETPYLGREVLGKIHGTYLRGTAVWDSGEVSQKPFGKLILRGQDDR